MNPKTKKLAKALYLRYRQTHGHEKSLRLVAARLQIDTGLLRQGIYEG